MRIRYTVRRYFLSTRGATAIEYAIVACMVAVAITGTVWMVGSAVKSDFETVASGISLDTMAPNKSPDPCQQSGTNCGVKGRRGRGTK